MNKSSTPTKTTLTKQRKKKSFARAMEQVYTYVSPWQQHVSRFLHLPAVERTSDVVGSTVARPVPLICGSLGVILIAGGMYLVAKRYGYEFSGSEPIIAFVLGWLIGIIIDYTRLLVRGRRSHR